MSPYFSLSFAGLPRTSSLSLCSSRCIFQICGKRESRRQASEAQREKGRQRSRARDKKQRRQFFVGRTTSKFCSGGNKMRNASGHQCKVKISGSEKKVNKKTCHISSIKRVTKTFLEVSRCRRATAKKCANLLFLLIRPIVVFHRSTALPSLLSIPRFYILFEQTINIIESFAFSPG